MLFSGPQQVGALVCPGKMEASHRRLTFAPTQSAPAPRSQTPLARRSAIAAAQRRPINRNLLDNVDNSIVDGYSSYGSPTYVTSADELPASPFTEDTPGGSTGPPLQAWQPVQTTWTDATRSPGDWDYDSQMLSPPPPLQQPLPPQLQQQQPDQQLQQPQIVSSPDSWSFRSRDTNPAVYGEDGYVHGGAAAWSSSGQAPGASPPQVVTEATAAAAPPPPTRMPGVAPTADMPSAQLEEPSAASSPGPKWAGHSEPPPRQLPRAAYARPPVGGVDWGEIEPPTDWGGFTYCDPTGWDEPYGGGVPFDSPAGTPTREGPAVQAMPAGSSPAGAGSRDGGGDGSSRSSSSDRGVEAWDGGFVVEPSGATEWSQGGTARREGPGWSPPYTSYGDWSGSHFAQDERYDAAAGASSGASGMGAAASTHPPPDAFRPSDILLLSGRDAAAMLPLAPMSAQVEFFQPRTLQERIVQMVGSIGTSVILSKAAVLAAPALLYPIWSPWIRAGLRNIDLYSKSFACVGLWRAQVLDVQINGLAIGGMLLSKQPPRVALLVGDPWVGGARASLELPYQIRSETIRVGDAVELLVLSRDERFTSFKVVREVYLPQSGVWLYDYPYVNRDLFVAFSVNVERQRRAAAAMTAEAQYYTYDVAADGGGGGDTEHPPASVEPTIFRPEGAAAAGMTASLGNTIEPGGMGPGVGMGHAAGEARAGPGTATGFPSGAFGSASALSPGDWK